MGFGDLKSQAGLQVLNTYLAERSYVEGLDIFSENYDEMSDSEDSDIAKGNRHVQSVEFDDGSDESWPNGGGGQRQSPLNPPGRALPLLPAKTLADFQHSSHFLLPVSYDSYPRQDMLLSSAKLHRYVPSQADNVVYDAVGKAPPANLPHALRWYNQMTSWQSKKNSLPGVRKPVASYGPASADNDDDDDDDDDDDLFGSDDEEAKALREKRLSEYAAKKSKKPALVAKSNIILDVKPWEDTTDMVEMERLVRTVEADGLLWGAAKLVPVGYGIKKLQICCVIEDDKISTDFLEEEITKFEDLVQSVDIAAFNKI
ncbi:elongation factor 1-beta [Plakobranchus ocellatus]|uniref:Elongation factor 1-beta n=1 Tax=Plakobranchus ocellatus TaxID=259542 RepID=A0AAV4DAE2_9GAST|nr:elongation factor 1-beta [Plakobranchus ocellatus]